MCLGIPGEVVELYADRADLATTCMTRVGAARMMREESLSGAGRVSCTFSVQ